MHGSNAISQLVIGPVLKLIVSLIPPPCKARPPKSGKNCLLARLLLWQQGNRGKSWITLISIISRAPTLPHTVPPGYRPVVAAIATIGGK